MLRNGESAAVLFVLTIKLLDWAVVLTNDSACGLFAGGSERECPNLAFTHPTARDGNGLDRHMDGGVSRICF